MRPIKRAKLVGQAERLVRLAIGPRAQKGFAGLRDAESEEFFGLLSLEPAQILDGVSGQGNNAVPTALRRLEPNSCLRLLNAFHHADHSTFKVNVPPTDGQDFPAPHPGRESQQHRPINSAVGEPF
jgi:hypothetical protein